MSIHIPKISPNNPWMMRLCTADMRDSHDCQNLRKNLPKILATVQKPDSELGKRIEL